MDTTEARSQVKPRRQMSRGRAAAIHLSISVSVAVATAALIYGLWYPPPYFQVAGGDELMLLIMGVDVMIGPFLTLVVFNPAKRWLKLDLAIIAMLQATAFAYGIYVIASARPVFIVGEVDRFLVVCANQLDDEDLAQGKQPEFRTRSWTGPRLVGAKPPAHGNDQLSVLLSALAGKGADKMPQYYVPYAEISDQLLTYSKTLDELITRGATEAEVIAAFLRQHGGAADDYRALPLHGRLRIFTMVVARNGGNPIAALPIDPW
jgi:hypothetical protein